MDENSLAALLEAYMSMASSAQKNTGIQGPMMEYEEGPGRLGMSEDSQTMRGHLDTMRRAGIQPPTPSDAGSGPGAEMMLLQIIQALMQQNLGGGMEQQQPQQPTGSAAVGSDNNRELLKALIGGG